jgi:PHD/YefM family antitoxin component YafN of YafNO toxin-antitoxin module
VIDVPNMQKASVLRNYAQVLDEVDNGNPVFLTREGKGNYAILDMDQYDAMREALWSRLYGELDEARQSGSVPLRDAVKAG